MTPSIERHHGGEECRPEVEGYRPPADGRDLALRLVQLCLDRKWPVALILLVVGGVATVMLVALGYVTHGISGQSLASLLGLGAAGGAVAGLRRRRNRRRRS